MQPREFSWSFLSRVSDSLMGHLISGNCKKKKKHFSTPFTRCQLGKFYYFRKTVETGVESHTQLIGLEK